MTIDQRIAAVRRRVVALLVLGLLGMAWSAFGQTVTVAWDASATPNVGYRVYRDSTLVGSTNALSFPIPVFTGPHQLGVSASLNGLESERITLMWLPAPAPQPSVSPNCSTATGSQQIVDSSLAVWSIATDQRILRNGTQAGNGMGSRILWANGAIYVLGTDARYWRWTGTAWSLVGVNPPACGVTPPPPPPPVVTTCTEVTTRISTSGTTVSVNSTSRPCP